MEKHMETQRTVLVVDDDKVLLYVLAEGLNAKRYRLSTCTTGDEALVRCDSERYDMVVLDYQIPGPDGLAVAEELRRKKQPFIFLTHSNNRDVADKAKEYGALNYLVKPTTPDELEIAIELALARQNDYNNLDKGLEVHGIIGVAAGLIMIHSGFKLMDALDKLRTYCQLRQLKMLEVAKSLIDDFETELNSGFTPTRPSKTVSIIVEGNTKPEKHIIRDRRSRY